MATTFFEPSSGPRTVVDTMPKDHLIAPGIHYEMSASPGLDKDRSTSPLKSAGMVDSISPSHSTTSHRAQHFTPTTDKLPPVARAHDILNLWLVGLLTVLTIGYMLGKVHDAPLLWATVLYFLIDTAFVFFYPESVKSPNTILWHHGVAMALVAVPFFQPQYMPCLADCMLVEINTWLLISKRTIRYFLPLQEALFYISWVVLRLVWYPYLIYDFAKRWMNATNETGTPWNPVLAAPLLQTLLTGLNVYWTLALLFRKKGPRSKQL